MDLNGGFWGFLIGFFSGFIANWAYKKWESYQRGTKPFIFKKIEGGFIKFEGQIQNSPTGQSAMNKVEKNLNDFDQTGSTSNS